MAFPRRRIEHSYENENNRHQSGRRNDNGTIGETITVVEIDTAPAIRGDRDEIDARFIAFGSYGNRDGITRGEHARACN